MLFIAQAREFGKTVQHLEGVGTLNTVSGQSWYGPCVSCPRRPSLFVQLEHGNTGGETFAFTAQVGPRDGPVQVEHGGFTVGRDAENNHALGHTREQEVRFLDGPCMGPAVVLHEQFSKRVRGLFSKKTVRSDDAEATAVFQNLKTALDEEPVEVDVASHGGEARHAVIGQTSQALAQFLAQLTAVFHASEAVFDSQPRRVGQHQFGR